MELITIVCISVSHQTTAHYRPVPYRDVLKSRVIKIQSDIHQFYDNHMHRCVCHHSNVYSSDLPKVVLFLWASERETYTMKSCIYQEFKRQGKDIIASLFTMHRETLVWNLTTFCNRSICASMRTMPIHELIDGNTLRTVGVINFIVCDTENFVIQLEGNGIQHDNSGIPTVSSWIRVRPLEDMASHVRTLICSSVQLTMNKAGKLRQTFFSVVGKSTDVIAKSTHNGIGPVCCWILTFWS